MRQHVREIKDQSSIRNIIRKAEFCRLGLYDGEFPYIVPMNFGYEGHCLYFHCAAEGKKIDCLHKNNRVCFELESEAEVIIQEEPVCRSSTKFRSVIGFGHAQLLETPEDKKRALDIIMRHYLDRRKSWDYDPKYFNLTAVIKVTIDRMSGKQSKHFVFHG